MKKVIFASAVLIVASLSTQAHSVGCLSGGAAGAVAGHYASHHAVLGAIGGCIAGHELHKKQLAAKRLQEQQDDPSEIRHTTQAPVPAAPLPGQ